MHAMLGKSERERGGKRSKREERLLACVQTLAAVACAHARTRKRVYTRRSLAREAAAASFVLFFFSSRCSPRERLCQAYMRMDVGEREREREEEEELQERRGLAHYDKERPFDLTHCF